MDGFIGETLPLSNWKILHWRGRLSWRPLSYQVQACADVACSHIANFSCNAKIGRYRGTADMAGLAAGSPRPE
jgi:hypothetical protein